MRSTAKYVTAIFCLGLSLVFPGAGRAQSVGQVECARGDGYVYLYSSMTTLDVRTTMQCGEQVQITGRYDRYFGVRTAKGDIGYVPTESLLLLKDKPGAKAPAPDVKTVQPARERMSYDAPAKHVDAAPVAPVSPLEMTLPNGTPIHLKLMKSISSATAHVGDVVDLKVMEEVMVDGISVIPAGSTAIGLVSEAEPKKRMGHGGKLAFGVNFVRLKDDEKAAVRSFQETTGANNGTAVINPLASGKEVVFQQGTEFTAYVDGDMQLKREDFQAEKSKSSTVAATPDRKP